MMKNPMTELEWAIGAMSTHILSMGTQATWAPRLNRQNFNEAVRILRRHKTDKRAAKLLQEIGKRNPIRREVTPAPEVADEIIALLGGIEGTKTKIAELEKRIISPRVSHQKRIDARILLTQLKSRLAKVEVASAKGISMRSENPTLVMPIKSKKQIKHLFRAQSQLSKAGVTFDAGTQLSPMQRHWELDWSLKGGYMKNPSRKWHEKRWKQLAVPARDYTKPHKAQMAEVDLSLRQYERKNPRMPYRIYDTKVPGLPIEVGARYGAETLLPSGKYRRVGRFATRKEALEAARKAQMKNPTSQITSPAIGEKFSCGCGGPTKIVSDSLVQHACRNKYAPATSYYDGVPKFIEYERVQINLKLTGGEIRYNWFVKWFTNPMSLRSNPERTPQPIGNIFRGLGILTVPLFIGAIVWLSKRYGK